MIMTKVMRVLREVKDEEIRGDFSGILSSLVEYSVSRAKTTLSFMVVGFMDEKLILSLMQHEESKLMSNVLRLNELSRVVTGEDIFMGGCPRRFAMQLFNEMHEKEISYSTL